MGKPRDSESIIEELEDMCHRNEYIVNLLSELKDNIVSRNEEIQKLKQEILIISNTCIGLHFPAKEGSLEMHKYLEAMEKINKSKEALRDIVNTGLCNLPNVRCDGDMFGIAEKALKEIT